MTTPVRERTLPGFAGPLSLVGCCLGMAAWLLPYFAGGASVWLLLLPAAGLLLVVLPVTPLRQLGFGLVISILVWPVTIVGFFLIAMLTSTS